MRIFLLLSCVLVSLTAHSRKPSNLEYTCKIDWKTILEELPTKKVVWRESTKVKIKDGLELALKSDDTVVTVTVTERSKAVPGNFTAHTFKCDQYLNCSGKKNSQLDGVRTKTDMVARPSGARGVGEIDGREYFSYNNLPKNGFEYNYVVYYSEDKKPLGLKVVCHE